MRSITANELPEWFKLSRYEKLDRLELRDWLPNLASRAMYLNNDHSLEEHRNEIEALLHENGKIPLIYSFDDVDFSPLINSNIIDPKTPLKTVSVRSLTIWDVLWLSERTTDGESKLSRQMLEVAGYLNLDEPSEELENFLRQPIDVLEKDLPQETLGSEGYLRVVVDLAAPDKVIIDDFSSWLSAARGEFDLPAQKFFTEAKRDDLIAYRVLPYLDLTLWAALEQVTIEHAVMAEALFPDAGVDAPYRVRKVTKVKADWAIQWPVIEALHKQVLSEG